MKNLSQILHTSMINFFLLNLTFEEKIIFLKNTDFFNSILKVLDYINKNSGNCTYVDLINIGIDELKIIAAVRNLKDYHDVIEKNNKYTYAMSELGDSLVCELLYQTIEKIKTSQFIKMVIADKRNHEYFNENNVQSILPCLSNKQLLNSEIINNRDNPIIGLIGLNGSGKSFWMNNIFKIHSCVKNAMGNKDESAEQLSFSSISELESYLETSKDLSFLAISGFGDSWDHNNIDKAYNILKQSKLKVVLEIHNTAALCQDYLPHSAYYLSTNCNDVPLPLHQCTERELRFGHNLRKLFESDSFFK